MDNDLIRVVIYPYDYEMLPYLRYNSMLKTVKPEILLTPNGWALENGKLYGYKVQTALSDDDYQSVDAIWITDSVNKISKYMKLQKNFLNIISKFYYLGIFRKRHIII